MNDKVKTKGGQEINDVMRFFHGDGPARQFESGQQKGGTFYCSVCGSNAHRVYEMDYILRCKIVSLQDKQKLLMKGVVSKKNSIDKANASQKPHCARSDKGADIKGNLREKQRRKGSCWSKKCLVCKECLHFCIQHLWQLSNQ